MSRPEPGPVRVEPVTSPAALRQFIRFPWRIYAGDPVWVPPLISQMEKRLDVERNPFFRYADRELFVAYRDGEIAGTIAALVNHQYTRQLNEPTGFFGFFETVDDPQVAAALIEAAAGWLRDRGLERMRGPVNGAPTDEAGLLLSGFDRRPAMWTGHSPPYYQPLIENLGFQKYDDVLAYEIWYDQLQRDLHNVPARFWRVADKARARLDVRVRATTVERWAGDIVHAHRIYNTAFRTIAGHTDMSLELFQNLAVSVRPFLDPDLGLVAEVGGEPVGFVLALPDINEVLCHFNGHISPWGLLKFQWYRRRIRTACFKLIGVLPEYRARGLEAVLIMELAQRLVQKKYERVEMSLASEKNTVINRMIERAGGRVYRRYRLYERPL